MSIAFYRSSRQQDCRPSNPADEPLTGDETLEDFVKKVRLREKSRAKRQLLPDLAPSVEANQKQGNLWRTVARAVSFRFESVFSDTVARVTFLKPGAH